MEAGQDAAPAGEAYASCTPGRSPGNPRRLLRAGPGPGTVANAKAGKAAWRVDWRVLPSSAPARRATPLALGDGKRDGPSPPDPNGGPAERWLFSFLRWAV